MTAPHHWPQVRPYGSQRRAVWPAGVTLPVSPFYLTDEAKAILHFEAQRLKVKTAEARARKEAIK